MYIASALVYIQGITILRDSRLTHCTQIVIPVVVLPLMSICALKQVSSLFDAGIDFFLFVIASYFVYYKVCIFLPRILCPDVLACTILLWKKEHENIVGVLYCALYLITVNVQYSCLQYNNLWFAWVPFAKRCIYSIYQLLKQDIWRALQLGKKR